MEGQSKEGLVQERFIHSGSLNRLAEWLRRSNLEMCTLVTEPQKGERRESVPQSCPLNTLCAP